VSQHLVVAVRTVKWFFLESIRVWRWSLLCIRHTYTYFNYYSHFCRRK